MCYSCNYINAFLIITVNHCHNTIKAHDDYLIIEIQSYVQINAVVGVRNIAEGSNLTLQVRNVCTGDHALRIHSLKTKRLSV